MVDKQLPELATRVEQVCHDKRLNPNELAKELGVTSTTIYKIMSGDTKNPSMDILTKFYQKLDVNMTWLATGEGVRYTDSLESKPKDGGTFGQVVLDDVAKGINELKSLFEDELRAKNLQIASLQESQKGLQEMLKLVLGKPNSVSRRPNVAPKMPHLSNTNLFNQVPHFE